MPGCNCPGSSCGCAIQPGPGIIVQGTGTAANPFVVSTDTRAVTIEQSSAGVLDLSSYVGDQVITVNLSANVTDIILPNAPGTRLDLIFVLVTAGRTVAMTNPPRGVTPAAPAVVGKGNWYQLRQASSFWVAITLGAGL